MTWRIQAGDARAVLAGWPAGAVQCVVTSPPYYMLRDYGATGQIGLERSIDEYVSALVEVFRAVYRVLAPDGTCWINLGDSYSNAGRAGSRGRKRGVGKPGWTDGGALGDKQLLLIPARVALALQADGWILRSEIIWVKRAPMPESVQDRPTKAHEQIYLFSKQAHYYYDASAVRRPHAKSAIERARYARTNDGTNKGAQDEHSLVFADRFNSVPRKLGTNGVRLRDVWHIGPGKYSGAHFATFPPEIPRRCILAGSRPGDIVADPFAGAGTVGVVALRHGRGFWGAELNPSYVKMATERIIGDAPLFNQQQEGAA